MKNRFGKGEIVFLLVVLLLGMGVYAIFYGLPWKSASYKKEFETYLEDKYRIDFQMQKMSFDVMHLRYSSHAYPTEDPTLVFYVGQDMQTKEFEDLYDYVLEKRRSGRK
ncbi:hypothetical protein QWJ34_21775 [Saccharibacillus sp. CPCC 101409]|uniref:hypothetical protein n=1 Tax=Saccharibacillus sp. CPCC 101409 TaxID=3058041 RepID=UPI0026724D8D|nr:hypothetical protein [Saccharibacillus sp. CPCC 101409]MDO3412409.1 hypothetical protein [Saccharibacillus sp. CPCC 101409]